MASLQRVTIARDDDLYLSFPDVAQAGDGRLVLVYREAYGHVATESRLVLLQSFDQGRTWGLEAQLDAPMSLARDGAVWNCPRITLQRDGGLTVVCDLSVFPPGATAPVPESDRRFRTYYWRTFDHGRTWGARRSTRIQGLVPDRLVELNDDTWLIASHCHSLRYFNTLRQSVTISFDAGETWTTSAYIAEVPGMHFCEGSIVRRPDGRLVCYMRENSMRNIPTHRCFSSDGGLHWSLPEPCRFIGHRPVAGLLRSGRTLVTYRDVRVVDPGAMPRVAVRPATMAWLGDPYNEASGSLLTIEEDEFGRFGDYGYSGWVQLPDGNIFCAYHHRGAAPKSYIRGARFREADFTEPMPITEAKLYY